MTGKETREVAEASKQSCGSFLVCLFFKWRNIDREKHLTLERVGWRPKYTGCQPTIKDRHCFCALSKMWAVALPTTTTSPSSFPCSSFPDQQPTLVTLFGPFLAEKEILMFRENFAEDSFGFQVISPHSLTCLYSCAEWPPRENLPPFFWAIGFLAPFLQPQPSIVLASTHPV